MAIRDSFHFYIVSNFLFHRDKSAKKSPFLNGKSDYERFFGIFTVIW